MRVVSADEAARLVESNDTIVIGGSGGGHAVPEALIAAIEKRFLAEGLPHQSAKKDARLFRPEPMGLAADLAARAPAARSPRLAKVGAR